MVLKRVNGLKYECPGMVSFFFGNQFGARSVGLNSEVHKHRQNSHTHALFFVLFLLLLFVTTTTVKIYLETKHRNALKITMNSKQGPENTKTSSSDTQPASGRVGETHQSGISEQPNTDTSGSILYPVEQELLDAFKYAEEFHIPVLALDSLRKIAKNGYYEKRKIQFTQSLEDPKYKALEEQYLQELDEELEDLMHKENMKNLAIENLLSSAAIKTAVYDTDPNKREKALLPLLAERDELEHQVLKLQEENAALEEQLNGLSLSTLQNHTDTKKALDKLVDAKQEQKEAYENISQNEREKYEAILKDVARNKTRTTILSEILPVCDFFFKKKKNQTIQLLLFDLIIFEYFLTFFVLIF